MSDTPLDNFHFDLSAIDLLTNNTINLGQVLEKVSLALDEFISDYASESSEQQDEAEDFSSLWEDMILNGIKKK